MVKLQIESKKCLLGVDIGTTGTKTMLFAADGQCCGHAYQAYETKNPKVGWSEQDPQDWWDAVVSTIRQVCGDSLGKSVAGISLSVQGGTTVPVNKEFNPVRPAILWNDIRCEEEREKFLEEVGSSECMYRKTGCRLGKGMNALQIRWMKDNEPENFEKTSMFLSVPDYISYRLTGIPALDPSNIGINQLGDIVNRRYDQQILRFSGIDKAQLPEIIQSGVPIGHLTQAAAAELGLTTDCVLVSGAHDQYAVALGAGACKSGDILIGSGTSWVVTSLSNDPDFDSGLAQSISAVPGLWGSLRSLSSGGVCLEWWRKKLTGEEGGIPLTFDVINAEAAKRNAGADGLFFYPFSGQHGKQKAFPKASFVGMDLSHDRFHLARAIMEGVVFQCLWMLESFHSQPSEQGIKLAGGAARSRLWCQIMANTAGLSVRIPETADLACVGAAILAGVGCGIYANVEEGYSRLAVTDFVIEPELEQVPAHREMFARYKETAKLLGNLYEQQNG